MEITRREIKSVAAEEDARPWLDLDIATSGQLEIGAANIDGARLPAENSSHDIAKLVADTQKSPAINDGRSTRIAIMMTLAHEVVAIWEGDLEGTYLAHLGFYEPATDSLEMIEFVDEATGMKTQAQAIAVVQAIAEAEIAAAIKTVEVVSEP